MSSSLGWTGRELSGDLHRDSDKSRAAWGARAPKVTPHGGADLLHCSCSPAVASSLRVWGQAMPRGWLLTPVWPSIISSGPTTAAGVSCSLAASPPPRGKALLGRRQSQDFIPVSAPGAAGGSLWLCWPDGNVLTVPRRRAGGLGNGAALAVICPPSPHPGGRGGRYRVTSYSPAPRGNRAPSEVGRVAALLLAFPGKTALPVAP